MFKNKSDLSIIFDSITKNFWSTGDLITGSVRLTTSTRISVSSIAISLVCEEKILVTTNKQYADVANRKQYPTKVPFTRKSNTHFVSRQEVLAYEPSGQPHILEAGEYLFPFTVEISPDIDQCPPSINVIGQNGLHSGVHWLLRATAHKSSKISKDVKTKQELRIFPQGNLIPKTTARVTGSAKLAELSGSKTFGEKQSLWAKIVSPSKQAQGTIEIILNYPSRGIPQRPQPPEFVLTVKTTGAPAQLNLVNIELLQKCDVSLKGNTDTYTAKKLIGSARVTRRVEGTQNLTPLITGIMLPECVPLPFKTNGISCYYELQVTVDFAVICDTVQESETFSISTPVEILPPIIDGVNNNAKNVAFAEPTFPISELRNLSKQNYPGSVAESRTSGVTSGTSGTWGSTDIPGPGEYLSNWLNGIVGGRT